MMQLQIVLLALPVLAAKPLCFRPRSSSIRDMSAEYRARAQSAVASADPWRWPIHAISNDTASVVDIGQFASVLDSRRLPVGPSSCSRRVGTLHAALDRIAGPAGAVAVAYVSHTQTSLKYGHMWEFLHAFWCAVINPRANTSGSTGQRELRVFLPAGVSNCSEEHMAVMTLFGSERGRRAFGVRIERAPFVPSCIAHTERCYAHGGVPGPLRGQVALLSNFMLGPNILPIDLHARFREQVYDALGLGSEPPATRSILYVRTSEWPTKRHVADEQSVVDALQQWAAAEHPSLRFSAVHVHQLTYAEEVAAFAEARVVISLWGSALHNCRFMRAGSLVVELYGAVSESFGDTFLYHHLCARSCGLLHAPLGIQGAISLRAHSQIPTALLSPERLVAHMRRVVPRDPCRIPDWLKILAEYATFIRAQVNPRTNERLPARLYRTVRSLPAQYRSLLPQGCSATH